MADTFEIQLDRIDGFQFRTSFPGTELAPLIVDEPAPLGTGTGPNPARMLAIAVGNCLSASLLFCLSKARVEVGGISTRVVGRYRRDAQKHLRIGGLEVTLRIDLADADLTRAYRCLDIYEDYCVVTASVRKGVDVKVTIVNAAGETLRS